MEKVRKILEIFERDYRDLGCALYFNSEFELLIATMLSAQTTDETVNKVTEKLFKEYNTPEKISQMSVEELENFIKNCGLYKTKAKNIIKTSKIILENFDGKVPNNLEDLTTLPGVGRKTANVVLANAYGKDTIAVDTHVFRVSNRIGLANANDVLNTEKQLMVNIPKKYWSKAHHWLIWHGRRVCNARRPKCDICNLKEYCNFYKNYEKNK